MIRSAYNRLAAMLVRLIVGWCLPLKRYVDYVHTHATPAGPVERRYMRRYVIFGYRTGDPPQTGVRKYLPNLYLHQMYNADADDSLHDHPWPWGLAFVLLGGYKEERFQGPHPSKNTIDQWLRWTSMTDVTNETETRTHTAPALNYIPGGAFHRVAELVPGWTRKRNPRHPAIGRGVFTLFLAGPRRKNKPWGYLVTGRGYVDQKTRHVELAAREVRP